MSRKLAASAVVITAVGIGALWLLRATDRGGGALPRSVPQETEMKPPSSDSNPRDRVERSAETPQELGIENYPPGETRRLSLTIRPAKECDPLPGKLLVLSSLDPSDQMDRAGGALAIDQASAAWRDVKGPLLISDVDWTRRDAGQDLLHLDLPVPAESAWVRILVLCPNARGELLVDASSAGGMPITLDLDAAGALDLTIQDVSRPGLDVEVDDEARLWIQGTPLVDWPSGPKSVLHAVRSVQIGGTIAVEGLPIGSSYDLQIVTPSGGEARLRDWHPSACQRSQETLEIPPGSSVSGRVTDDGGRPIMGVLIGINLRVTGIETRGSTTTDSEGHYRAEFYGSGHVSLSISKPGFQPHLERIGSMRVGESIENVDVVLAASPTLSGIVRRADGSAVAGALVDLRDAEERFDPVHDSTANEQGRFTLQARNGLPVLLWALTREPQAEGPVEVSQLLVVSEPSDALELVVETPAGGVRGLVRDDAGGIAAACRVSARLIGDERGAALDRAVQTDDLGAFVLEGLVDGRWRIEASVEGHRPHEPQWIEIRGALVTVDLVLERPGAVRGSVVDASGARIEQAEISFAARLSPDWPAWNPSSSSETTWEEDGTFRIAALAPGIYKVLARVAGRAYGESEPIAVLAGATADAGAIFVTQLGAIHGSVRDAASGAPMAGIQVIRRLVGDLGLPVPQMTTSDDAGAFELQGVRPGLHSVELIVRRNGQPGSGADGFGDMGMPSRVVEVRAGETAEVELLLNEAPSVVLEGVAEGAFDRCQLGVELHPLEGPEDVFHPYSRATTEAAGRFRLTSRAPGWHLLTFGPNTTRPIHEEVVQLHEGLNTCLVQIPAGRLSGRILTSEPRATTSHRIQLESVDAAARFGWRHDGSRYEQAALDGSFVFESLEPGRYVLRAGGFVDALDATTASVVMSGIQIEAGAETKLEDIVLDAGYSLLGSTVDSAGQAVPVAEVLVWTIDGELVRRPAWSDHLGRFRIQGLAAGDGFIGSRTGTLACAPERFTIREAASELPIVLRLSPAPEVTVELHWTAAEKTASSMLAAILRDGSGCIWPRSGAAARVWTAFSKRGEAHLELGALPPGSYRIELTSPEGLHELRELELDAKLGARIERIELPTRAPR